MPLKWLFREIVFSTVKLPGAVGSGTESSNPVQMPCLLLYS
jgi:hypothetical protein